MSGTIPPIDPEVEALLKLFYPQYFDPASPHYVDPDILAALSAMAYGFRPLCLSDAEQDLAQALYTAYLINLRSDTSTGQKSTAVAGPITSEKEGDISVTYATTQSGVTNMSKRPPSDPWDAWNRLWMRCARGVIITRFGDPCR